MTNNRLSFWLPYKPCTVADLINRQLVATGSVDQAKAGHFSDFNGHLVQVWFNYFKGYWLAEYTWAGRQVLARGSFAECLDAAHRFHLADGAMGCVIVDSDKLTDADVQLCTERGMEPYSQRIAEARINAMFGWKFSQVNTALWMARHFGSAAPSFLIRAETEADYNAMMAEERKASGRRGMFDEEPA